MGVFLHTLRRDAFAFAYDMEYIFSILQKQKYSLFLLKHSLFSLTDE